ncbi:unnamed protein product [Ceutorhynchus assimilis]|uniref:Cytochrome P450 n=1 Tax=Ceutorhynchus assimilis TaxID=467358 RepID=A0A9N9MV46_9CUCU|nr:unnamed protein product [Ceutorhynchus assimilis]
MHFITIEMVFYWLFLSFCAVPLIVLFISKWRYSYWKRRGVVQLNPEFLFGDLRDMLTAKISMGEAFKTIYFTLKNKKLDYGGIYLAFNPVFIPLNLQLIKDMLMKSFDNFQDRGIYNNPKDLLSYNLFRMGGRPWKQLRVKLTPTFTSSKMKMMFETLTKKIDKFPPIIDQCIRDGSQINVTDVSGRFTTDVIGSCAFGIECDSLSNPACDFRIYGKKVNEPNYLRQWMEKAFPKNLLPYVGFKTLRKVEDFYKNIVLNTIEHREKNTVIRKDFMQLLLQLRNLSDDEKLINNKEKNQTRVLSDDEIIAQCFIIFIAGVETSTITMALALYEAAKNSLIQDKMRQEIRQVFAKYDDKFTYEAAKELVYMEQVILETLRKYPVSPTLPRVCTKRYNIPGTTVFIEKGTTVEIPIWGIHMDPDYYPNPDIFDPERFSQEEKAKRSASMYLPFGEGPRTCIGARFGMLQVKTGLVGLLKDYRYSISSKTPNTLSYTPTVLFLLHPNEDIFLKPEKI